MTKKILLTILLTLVMAGSVFNQELAYAQSAPAAPPSSEVKSAQFMFDLGATTQGDIKSTTTQSWMRKGINFVFERAITIMAGTVGAVAVLIMALGGLMMIGSAGDQTKYDKGKAYIIKAIKGLVFVLGAYILVTTIQILIKSIFTT
jgi:hypothetical protein